MTPASMLVVLASYSVSFGWQPLADGSTEYIVQIEPALAEAMIRNGDVISSVVPPEVQGVRRFRIQVGNEKLPRTSGARTSAQRTSGEQALPEYTGYQRFANDASADDRRRWVMPDFTVPPDDPSAARAPIEPYRPVTPSFNGETTARLRGIDVEAPSNTFAGRAPALGAESSPVVHNKPAITKADTSKLTQAVAATNTAAPLAALVDNGKQPWLPLTFTALLLFASLGANLYLGWLARDYYLRFRELVSDDSPAMI